MTYNEKYLGVLQYLHVRKMDYSTFLASNLGGATICYVVDEQDDGRLTLRLAHARVATNDNFCKKTGREKSSVYFKQKEFVIPDVDNSSELISKLVLRYALVIAASKSERRSLILRRGSVICVRNSFLARFTFDVHVLSQFSADRIFLYLGAPEGEGQYAAKVDYYTQSMIALT